VNLDIDISIPEIINLERHSGRKRAILGPSADLVGGHREAYNDWITHTTVNTFGGSYDDRSGDLGNSSHGVEFAGEGWLTSSLLGLFLTSAPDIIQPILRYLITPPLVSSYSWKEHDEERCTVPGFSGNP
jgi:hypothetical protein